MTMMLDKGNAFAGVKTVVTGISTPPLMYCMFRRWGTEGFALLLRHGASVRDHDFEGNTCLHLCFNSLHSPYPPSQIQRARDAIIYLIQQGADVFAENIEGQSVSDIAYSLKFGWSGDIWDCALARCGYDVSHFRLGRTRQAKYGPHYTRDDFEDLWSGAEHLCPYYDPQEDDIYVSHWPPGVI